MSHHVARLIEEADRAREINAPDAAERTANARDAIIRLWAARISWPTGWPPPTAATMVKLLDSLPDIDAPVWQRTTVLGRLHDLHHQLLGALIDLATSAAPKNLEQEWLSTFGELLTPDEAMMLQRVASAPRRTEAMLRWWRRQGDEHPLDMENGDNEGPTAAVLAIADEYRNFVVSLVRPKEASEPDTEIGTTDDDDEGGSD